MQMTEITLSNVLINEDGSIELTDLKDVIKRAITTKTRANVSIIVEPITFDEIQVREVKNDTKD